jgi:surfactin synthase thioesterase subunit
MTPSGWFQCWRPVSDPRARLVCLPHVGGSAAFFRDWPGQLPGVEVLAVRYPGRAERIDEPPATDLRGLGADIAAAVAGHAAAPLALFGHSMGAAVALETARALQSAGVPVAHLFASGSSDAPLPPPRTEPESDDQLVESLARMGGTDAGMLEDELFRELVLPYVRGDSEMFHAYRMAAEPVLIVPVTVLTGDEDEDADQRPWSELTRAPVRHVSVPGGHFYLTEQPPWALVAETLAAPADAAWRAGLDERWS